MMEYKECNEQGEKIYQIIYEKEKLKELLDRIVKVLSYRKEGKFDVPDDATVDPENKLIVSGARLPNGDLMFEDIKRIYPFTSQSIYSHHNDSIGIEATRVVAPSLAYIIKDILDEKTDCISNLLRYENSLQLKPIQEQIDEANSRIDSISNYNTDEKIVALAAFQELLNKKKNGEFFDTELLRKYYDEACSYIKYQLISEKIVIKDGEKKLIRDFKK